MCRDKMKDFTSQIKDSLDALLKLENDESENKKLFDKDKNICLRVTLFRIPKMKGVRKKYLKLRHSRFGEDPDVCLFVPNRKSEVNYKISTDDSINVTVDYYQDFLQKHKIKGIKTIMPLKQLQCEYASYELRRKLVNRFDLFLCKTSLLYNQRFINALGKFFIKKNKEPLGISFPPWDAPSDENFKKSVERAILSTTLKIKAFTDNYGIIVGSLSQPKKHIEENLNLVLDQILNDDVIPGGFSNVRGMYLGTSSVASVPLYISSDFPENLPRPVVKSRREVLETVEDEITTLPGRTVVVKPGGEVIVKKIPKTDEKSTGEEDEETEDDLEDIESGSEEEEEGNEDKGIDDDDDDVAFKKKPQSKENRESEDDDDDDDDEIEERENRLLRQSALMKDEEEEEEDDDEDEDEESEDEKEPPKKMRKSVKVEKNKKIVKNKKGKNQKSKKQRINVKSKG